MPDRPTYRPVFKTLHRPLTVGGVDHRLFFSARLLAAATFNLFHSFVAGLLMFGGLYDLCAVGDGPRCGDAADSPGLLAGSPPLRSRQTRPVRDDGGAVVRLARILHDYREAGSVKGLLALWGFVDDTTFLTKAGHVGVVYGVRGVDADEAVPDRLALRMGQALDEAGLRLLDGHCRVSQYLLKAHDRPIVSAPCPQPIAHEAIQGRAAYLIRAQSGTWCAHGPATTSVNCYVIR